MTAYSISVKVGLNEFLCRLLVRFNRVVDILLYEGRGMGVAETCYACDRLAMTTEHVPPKCIFPEKKDSPKGANYRVDLIEVPSCEAHNTKKSKDDEFLKLVLTSCLPVNPIGQRHFSGSVIRSLKRRPWLVGSLMPNLVAFSDDESSPGIFRIDSQHLKRLNGTVSLIARGLYYHTFGEKWLEPIWVSQVSLIPVQDGGEPRVCEDACSSQIPHLPAVDQNRSDRNQVIDTVVKRYLQGESKRGAHPEIFYYQIRQDQQFFATRLVFYEGFVVNTRTWN